jgi:hypothetical protein
MTVPRKFTPKKITYSDGEGVTMTENQWFSLSQTERDRIMRLVDDQIKRITKGGAA